MIDKIPPELFPRIAKHISQDDKVSLTYCCRDVRMRIISSLYENLFLNEKPYFPSDLDANLGTNFWSVLCFQSRYETSINSTRGKRKLKILVRSLQESAFILCPLVKRVHCSWHLDTAILFKLIKLLMTYGTSLQYFSNILEEQISRLLLPKASQLRSLDVVPPFKIPAGRADSIYYGRMEVLLSKYNWENINELTLHVNGCTFFPHLNKPLKIKSLCLNLRPDTFAGSFFEQPYYSIFDTDALEELEILSWYHTNESTANLYDTWNLPQFWEFSNIKSLTMLSLVANESFLCTCFQKFNLLERLKVDYMFDIPISTRTIEILARSKASKTIKYIDIKFDSLQIPIFSLNPVDTSSFRINLNCQCHDCKQTFNDIIIQKIFPTNDSLSVRNPNDDSSRSYYFHVFKLTSILPYTHFIDRTPAISYHCTSLQEHASDINYLLKKDGANESRYVNENDVLRLYHAHIHSLKKTFDFFLNHFISLDFLTLNDLPTKVFQVDELQRSNVPIFYSKGYSSNQIYELVTDESLFN
ncbi:hypothetical protein HG535_0G04080 [Zygotorulaspora mrakii]|uniref:F-box domain-containing protein n=1 Tax=Zygotorulaspora mrakii TaxID=42260 RepID=A0A7H9B721_ZYGMR|nr:uncharacterized protein HG535_0G04080 [Zygotorulaspora mrakii]QLG74525.1 hypothetical protein HG535_0G04080 [Zygotorulaspora mrakii]